MTTMWAEPLDDAHSPVPSTWALVFTDAVAQYAQELWAVELKIPEAPQPYYDQSIIDTQTRDEVRHLVFAFSRALRKQCEFCLLLGFSRC